LPQFSCDKFSLIRFDGEASLQILVKAYSDRSAATQPDVVNVSRANAPLTDLRTDFLSRANPGFFFTIKGVHRGGSRNFPTGRGGRVGNLEMEIPRGAHLAKLRWRSGCVARERRGKISRSSLRLHALSGWQCPQKMNQNVKIVYTVSYLFL